MSASTAVITGVFVWSSVLFNLQKSTSEGEHWCRVTGDASSLLLLLFYFHFRFLSCRYSLLLFLLSNIFYPSLSFCFYANLLSFFFVFLSFRFPPIEHTVLSISINLFWGSSLSDINSLPCIVPSIVEEYKDRYSHLELGFEPTILIQGQPRRLAVSKIVRIQQSLLTPTFTVGNTRGHKERDYDIV